MHLHWIDITIMVSYVVLVIVVGAAISKRASKDLDAYFLGGRSLPWWVIGLAAVGVLTIAITLLVVIF